MRVARVRDEAVAEKILSESCDPCVVSAKSSRTSMRRMPRKPGEHAVR